MPTAMNPARSRIQFDAEARLATLLAERARILKFLSMLSASRDVGSSGRVPVAADRQKIDRIRPDARLPR